jgi:hypothetical protein
MFIFEKIYEVQFELQVMYGIKELKLNSPKNLLCKTPLLPNLTELLFIASYMKFSLNFLQRTYKTCMEQKRIIHTFSLQK